MRARAPTKRLARALCAALWLASAARAELGRAQPTPEPARAAGEPVPISAAASQHFNEGVRYLTTDAPDRYRRAYREFRAAYADSPSWKILGNLGIVAQELERDGEAMDAFERYLAEGAGSLVPEEVEQFQRDLALLRAEHATVELELDGDQAWVVDERLPEAGAPVVNRYGPFEASTRLRLRPGHHRIRVERAGLAARAWDVNLRRQASESHRFDWATPTSLDATAPPEPTPPFDDQLRGGVVDYRTEAFVSLGLAAVGAGVAGWIFHESRQTQTESDQLFGAYCPGRLDPSVPGCQRSERLNDRAARWRTGAAISGGVAGVALVVGATLFLVSDPTTPAPAARPEGAVVQARRLAPWVGLNRLGVSGSF